MYPLSVVEHAITIIANVMISEASVGPIPVLPVYYYIRPIINIETNK